ncbi:carbonic anhydrase family protein [Uliginosibacterium paludis]|uniref:carbonic anhydrase n=1 Tax=Uliginosibacterium paludis TaxID=1615952 RepID=A0ABV2CSS2_9RHOO
MGKLILLLLTSLTTSAMAADWTTVATDPVRTVDVDRSSILDSDGGTRVAWARIQLADSQAAQAGYKTLRTLNRYDCRDSAFEVVKRVYLSAQGQILREEVIKTPERSPIRPGTADERVFREICPLPKAVARKTGKPRSLEEFAREAGRRAAEASQHDPRLISDENAQHGKIVPAIDKLPVTTQPAAVVPVPPPVTQRSGSIPPGVLRQPVAPRASARGAKPAAEAAPAPAGHDRHWSYGGDSGPEAWASLDPANSACRNGKRQSPIDIRDGIKVNQEALDFDYKTSFFRIVDNGHTIQVSYGAGSRLSVMGKRYELLQFHFHSPSEERVEGRSYDMVMHMVHRDVEGNLAVVAVLLQEGKPNPLIQTLWNNLPLERNQEYMPNQSIAIADILPANRDYYAYMGSLTTPPCTEGVLWLVLKQPVELSREQIAVFHRFHAGNARPIQPANGRIIKESR